MPITSKLQNVLAANVLVPANANEIYVDAVAGSDTTGTGNVINPYATLTKALSECPSGESSVIKAAPGIYSGAPINWVDNISLVGPGTGVNIQHDINYTASAIGESFVTFDGVDVGSITCDLSAAGVCFLKLSRGGFGLTRTDSAVGPHVAIITDATIGDIDIKGNVLVNNGLFVSTCNIQDAGTLLAVGCTFGISAEMYGTAQAYFTASTFIGTINGNIDGGNTPEVFIDSSSDLGTFTGAITLTYTDNAQYISYNPAVFGDWVTLPTTVQEGLDELAATVAVASGTPTKDRTSNGSITGAIDNSNVSFTLSAAPLSNTLELTLNGLVLVEGVDYTLAGSTITLSDPPQTAGTLDELAAKYLA